MVAHGYIKTIGDCSPQAAIDMCTLLVSNLYFHLGNSVFELQWPEAPSTLHRFTKFPSTSIRAYLCIMCHVLNWYLNPQISGSYVYLKTIVISVVCEITDADDVDAGSGVGARPRRMSEIKQNKQTLPIPPASSFFIFSPTNRWNVVDSGALDLVTGFPFVLSNRHLYSYG